MGSSGTDRELDRITSNVRSFFKRYEKFKTIEEQYKELQSEFNENMDSYFDRLAANRKTAKFEDTNGDVLSVTRVAPTKIEWIPEKLRARVTKPIWKQLVKKHYEVINMPGLIK